MRLSGRMGHTFSSMWYLSNSPKLQRGLLSRSAYIEFQAGEDGLDYSVAAGGGEGESFGAGGAEASHEFAAEQFVRTMEADLYVGVGDGEDLRGLRRAHLFEIAENENGPVGNGQGEDQFFEHRA